MSSGPPPPQYTETPTPLRKPPHPQIFLRMPHIPLGHHQTPHIPFGTLPQDLYDPAGTPPQTSITPLGPPPNPTFPLRSPTVPYIYILSPPPPPPLLNPTSTSDPFRTPPTLTLSILLRLRHLGAVGRGVTWRGGDFRGSQWDCGILRVLMGFRGMLGILGGLGRGGRAVGGNLREAGGGLWAPGPPHGSSCGLELVTADGLKA